MNNEWEKEFDLWFPELDFIPDAEKYLKGFIRKTLSNQLQGIKDVCEKKKYTFKRVDWGDGIISDEPVEDDTKCLEYAKGFNQALTDIIKELLPPNKIKE